MPTLPQSLFQGGILLDAALVYDEKVADPDGLSSGVSVAEKHNIWLIICHENDFVRIIPASYSELLLNLYAEFEIELAFFSVSNVLMW